MLFNPMSLSNKEWIGATVAFKSEQKKHYTFEFFAHAEWKKPVSVY